MGAFIAKLLLPTISSLALFLDVSVATKRGFHMEAMVYFFTMFFTAIYHACDGPGLSVLCFMKYDILEYFSVFGTAISIWVTLLALGDFDEPKRSSLTMFGVLIAAVRIYHDRWGYGVYSGPIGTAVLMITIKWLQKMKERKGLYPKRSVYTQQVGPGCCFGALALMLRFYFEEWDYAYVHSFYHLSMAVSFILLLPKSNRYSGSGGSAAKLNCYTLCCCVKKKVVRFEERVAALMGSPSIVGIRGGGDTDESPPPRSQLHEGPQPCCEGKDSDHLGSSFPKALAARLYQGLPLHQCSAPAK